MFVEERGGYGKGDLGSFCFLNGGEELEEWEGSWLRGF